MGISSKSAGDGVSSGSGTQTGTLPNLDFGTIAGAQGAREEVAIILEKIRAVALAGRALVGEHGNEDARVLFDVIHGLTDDDGCLSQIEGVLMAAQREVSRDA